ncbi:MAG: hypothetical protein SPI94_04370 [Candidatus Onthovivens sp.]|nr:hypothetical protein [Clostridium sp.]MDY5984685.1 hypothetical protein [Candidatus Onthovivens sp.]
MSDTLNWTYKKNRGKKYIIGELRENNWEEGYYDKNTFYTVVTPFKEQDNRRSIEVAIYLDREEINLSLLGKYGEIHIDVKIPEDCFINPRLLDGGLNILDFVQECIYKICHNVDFSDVEKVGKILSEYSENY